MMSTPVALLERMRAAWYGPLARPTRRVVAAALALGALLAVLLGRAGTLGARGVGAVVLLALPVVLLLASWQHRRRRRDPAGVLADTVGRTEPALGRRALRALRLVRQTAERPTQGSTALAELHFARTLSRASFGLLGQRARRTSWIYSVVALVLACGGLMLVVSDPFRFVEGVDVLVARDGVGPLDLEWLSTRRVLATPPAYLGTHPHTVESRLPASLPTGTELTIRGAPGHDGRALVLTDGGREVDFVNDRHGQLVAKWTVTEDASLHVAARFGEVILRDPEPLEIHAIADLPPRIHLDGAPRTIELLDQPRVSIHYEATDDHGLEEVALVLRAGAREERRSQSEPKGRSRLEKGGLDLSMDDPFFKRTYLPVEIVVEARDNDAVAGPKWGRSASLIVVPPRIGEREALRYAALRGIRNELTDLLAWRLEARRQPSASSADRQRQLGQQRRRQQQADRRIRKTLAKRFGGLAFGGAVRALVRGQLERLDRAWRRHEAGPRQASTDRLIERSESALLATDAALALVGGRDTRRSARKLSDVAAEAAASIEMGRKLDERARANQRLDAALQVLGDGAEHLVELGRLGRDLGELVQNGLRRIRRAWADSDRYHARLAAEDLAARLREPNPSFDSAGGSGTGGVEAGGRPAPGSEPASDAASEAAGIEQALEQLRQEHAAEVSSVRRALRQASQQESPQSGDQQMREHAQSVRQAVNELPRQAGRSASSRAAAASARAQAEAMAGALERGQVDEAARHGQQALRALSEAGRMGRSAPEGSTDAKAAKQVPRARERLAPEVAWAEQTLKELQRRASERAAKQLDRSAKRERELAKRARAIRRRSAEGAAPLPGSLLDRLADAAKAMDAAAQRLGRKDGPGGLEQQREAQRLLEMAQPESEQADGSEGDESGDGSRLDQEVDVPGARRNERADEFRKRVTDGLRGQVPPQLRDALRRYAEGLLR